MLRRFLYCISIVFLLYFYCISPSFAILDETEPVFESEFIPHEFIVKFKEGQNPNDLNRKVWERTKRGTTLGGLLQNMGEDLFARLKGQETPEEALEGLQNLEAKVKVVEKEYLFALKMQEKVLGASTEEKTAPFDDYFLLKTSSQVDTLAAIEEFQKDPKVEFAEPNYIMKLMEEPNDPYWQQGKMWGLEKIEMEKAWDINKGSKDIIVAVIDSGVDYNHEDFKGGSVEIIKGPNYAGCGLPIDDPMDQFGHGTHVAGTIGAATNNNLGVAGINWNIKIMAIKIGCKSRSVSAAGGAKGIVYAADNGAKVINMSWGGSGSNTLKDAVKYAYKKGLVLVGAAGNSGAQGVICPACFGEVMAVGATNSQDKRASFSNYGSRVDVGAPGQGIYSLRLGGGFTSMSGTSMASPHVAGAAALILAQNPGLSPDEVKNVLVDSGDDIGNQGVGPRINVYKALEGGKECDADEDCPDEEKCCSHLCIDTDTNENHCGECNHPCEENEICQDGECVAEPTPTGSPTPTPTPPPGLVETLTLTVKLQGINSQKSDKDMDLKITPGGVDLFPRFTCDFAGNYTTTVDLKSYNLESGSYTISVKEPHHLTQRFSVTLNPGENLIVRTNPEDELPAGDINNDDAVDEKDLELLNQAYSPFSVVDAVEDLDEDGYVNSLDYSLLLTNIAWIPKPPPTRTPTPTPTATPTPAPSPTATPTATPEPTISCEDACVKGGYTYGYCRWSSKGNWCQQVPCGGQEEQGEHYYCRSTLTRALGTTCESRCWCYSCDPTPCGTNFDNCKNWCKSTGCEKPACGTLNNPCCPGDKCNPGLICDLGPNASRKCLTDPGNYCIELPDNAQVGGNPGCQGSYRCCGEQCTYTGYGSLCP